MPASAKLIRWRELDARSHLEAVAVVATDAASELHVLRHDGHALGVDRAEVGVLEQGGEVSLGSLLKCHNGVGLEAEISLEVLSNLANQALERKLANKKLGALLVLADLAKSNSAGPGRKTMMRTTKTHHRTRNTTTHHRDMADGPT